MPELDIDGPGASLVSSSPCTACPAPAEVVGAVSDNKLLIQDFCPVENSIDWKLGQLYFRQRGHHSFLSGDVPFTINNDGYFSKHAAELLFTSLVEAERRGPLPARVSVLELGAGIGLFARFLLDNFSSLCQSHGKDYYRRLSYHVTDGSPRMIDDLLRSPILRPHAAQCRVSVADARLPDMAVVQDGSSPVLQAVFLNYVLDSLPATFLRFPASGPERLYVRTRLPRGLRTLDYSRLEQEELLLIAQSDDTSRWETLVDFHPLFSLDFEFRPCSPEGLPYIDEARGLACPENPLVVSNYAAVETLRRLLPLLSPGGFILIGDYAQSSMPSQAKPGDPPPPPPYQRYGGATAIGLNFDLFKKCFDSLSGVRWVEPFEENEHLHSRLLAREPDAATVQQFKSRFSKTLFDWTHQPTETARELRRNGRHDSAMACFREALVRQPSNWALCVEVANHMLSRNEPESAKSLAESALRLNPLSSEAWNILGDALWALDSTGQAHRAFLQALHVYPADVRARHNLVYTFSKLGDLASALQMIAEGLCLDTPCHYRDRLLERQREILARIDHRQKTQSRIMSERSLGFQRGEARSPFVE